VRLSRRYRHSTVTLRRTACCCRDLPISRAEQYRALEAIAVDIDDEQDVEAVLASLREARQTVAERRHAR
jgi:hypothetical protein